MGKSETGFTGRRYVRTERGFRANRVFRCNRDLSQKIDGSHQIIGDSGGTGEYGGLFKSSGGARPIDAAGPFRLLKTATPAFNEMMHPPPECMRVNRTGGISRADRRICRYPLSKPENLLILYQQILGSWLPAGMVTIREVP